MSKTTTITTCPYILVTPAPKWEAACKAEYVEAASPADAAVTYVRRRWVADEIDDDRMIVMSEGRSFRVWRTIQISNTLHRRVETTEYQVVEID